MAADDTTVKPRLRGVLHQWAAVVAVLLGAVLVGLASSPRAKIGAGVFAVSLVTLLTVSATYHRITWSPRARVWMRRLDHAAIFVLIAGTYTPMGLLGIQGEIGTRVVTMVWVGAALGILQSLFWVDAPKALTAALCVALGWVVVPYTSALRQALGTSATALLFVGGVAYTLGAVAYATKRPKLRPEVFGYHEVFHALTLVGASLHYVAVALAVGVIR